MTDSKVAIYQVGDVMRFKADIDVDMTHSRLFKNGTHPKVYTMGYVTWCMVNDVVYDFQNKVFTYSLIPLSSAPFMTFRINEDYLEDKIGTFLSEDIAIVERIWSASGVKRL